MCLSKIGSIKVKLHRLIEGTIKTCTVKYEAGQWYVIFSCEVEQPAPLSPVTNLVKQHQVMVFEQLELKNVTKHAKPKQDENGRYLPNGAAAKSGLTKSILDAGWGQFQQMCVSKAEWAGRTVLFVNPKYTSQVCSQCGTVRKKTLEERWHSCECGAELDRDTNAAINILRLGRSQQVLHSCASGGSPVEAPRL